MDSLIGMKYPKFCMPKPYGDVGTNSGNNNPLVRSFCCGIKAKGNPMGVGIPLIQRFIGPATMRFSGTTTPLLNKKW